MFQNFWSVDCSQLKKYITQFTANFNTTKMFPLLNEATHLNEVPKSPKNQRPVLIGMYVKSRQF